MYHLAAKAIISGILIAAASELAKRYPGFGALIASLPLVSVLGMIWVWHDRRDPVNMAAHTPGDLLVCPAITAVFPADPMDAAPRRWLLVGVSRRVRADHHALSHHDLRAFARRHPAMTAHQHQGTIAR